MSHHQEQIEKLRREIQELQASADWYRRTYHDRRLAGVVRDRLQRRYPAIARHRGADLETRIRRYIDQNPLTVKQLDRAEPVSIIMLSFNRVEDTRRAIRAIYRYTRPPFEVIILDNNSNEETRRELRRMARRYRHLTVVLETVNLGCAGGRVKAQRFASHDYLLFLDNDIMVSPYYLENLFAQLYRSDAVAGVCCKVVFPDGRIQFNGGRMLQEDGYALYSLYDEGRPFDEEATNQVHDCQWIPGGATLWRRKVFEQFEIDGNMRGSFEDNEISLRMIRAGYTLANAPGAIVIHDHYDFKNTDFKQKEIDYFRARNHAGRIQDALLHFYQKHQLIFSFSWKNNPWDIIWNLNSREEILRFIAEKTHAR
ncbi:MAG TPA: glycosyltransferase family 2 protein [Chitinophagaceae bacterium]|nr:glycosyltransferase family 2 protein [Chitinophagaceae bacterium]